MTSHFTKLRRSISPLLALGLGVTFFLTSLPLAQSASASGTLTLIAQDHFNYPTGSLNGQNGGAGWSTPWTSVYNASNQPSVFGTSTTGLTYPGLAAVGGSTYGFLSSGNQVAGIGRTLPLQNTGIVYLQYLTNFNTQSGGGTPNIRLSATGLGGTGLIGGNGPTVYSYYDANGTGFPTTKSLFGTHLVIVQFNYTANTTKMWVDTDLTTFDYSNPTATPDVSTNTAAPFDTISLFSRNYTNYFDEISVFSELPDPVIPEKVIPSDLHATSRLLISADPTTVTCTGANFEFSLHGGGYRQAALQSQRYTLLANDLPVQSAASMAASYTFSKTGLATGKAYTCGQSVQELDATTYLSSHNFALENAALQKERVDRRTGLNTYFQSLHANLSAHNVALGALLQAVREPSAVASGENLRTSFGSRFHLIVQTWDQSRVLAKTDRTAAIASALSTERATLAAAGVVISL